jgi:uncharacterized coiled-coil protein SlyX
MANDKLAGLSIEELAARLEAVESLATVQGQTLTAVKQGLAKAVNDFSPVGARVGELSSAFQEANTRLAAVEALLVGMETPDTPGDLAQQVEAVRASLGEVDARLSAIEQTRARSGRLSNRLAAIEAKLAEEDPQ